jgi:hypothetical protein
MIKDAEFLSEMLIISSLLKILANQVQAEKPVVCMRYRKDKSWAVEIFTNEVTV